jgi:hypothetical protein
MKIKKEDQARVAEAIKPFDTPEVRAAYLRRDPSIHNIALVKDIDRRYRWALFYMVRGWQYVQGYDDLTDAHIDTMLRRIVKPLGEEK